MYFISIFGLDVKASSQIYILSTYYPVPSDNTYFQVSRYIRDVEQLATSLHKQYSKYDDVNRIEY